MLCLSAILKMLIWNLVSFKHRFSCHLAERRYKLWKYYAEQQVRYCEDLWRPPCLLNVLSCYSKDVQIQVKITNTHLLLIIVCFFCFVLSCTHRQTSCVTCCVQQTHQRLDVTLHRVVVTTQVGHEAEARHDDVVIVRLAVAQDPREYG